jgi:hypothetical protein
MRLEHNLTPVSLPLGRRWRAAWWWLGVWLWLLSAVGPGAGAASGGMVSHEYPLKAIFMLNFARFTAWPTKALADPKAPFVIGVLGDDPFDGILEDAVHEENWNGHPISVQRYARLEDIRTCHVLFISESETWHVPKILAALKTKAILTVTDIDGGEAGGVIVQFVTDNNKIRFKINVDSLREANLTMSSKLLRLAEIVPAQNK